MWMGHSEETVAENNIGKDIGVTKVSHGVL